MRTIANPNELNTTGGWVTETSYPEGVTIVFYDAARQSWMRKWVPDLEAAKQFPYRHFRWYRERQDSVFLKLPWFEYTPDTNTAKAVTDLHHGWHDPWFNQCAPYTWQKRYPNTDDVQTWAATFKAADLLTTTSWTFTDTIDFDVL